MAKKYGTTELSNYSENLKKDQAERRGKLKKLFSGPLFPKGTGGIFPKYDESLKKKQANVEVEMPKAKSKVTSKSSGVNIHSGASKKTKTADANGNLYISAFASICQACAASYNKLSSFFSCM